MKPAAVRGRGGHSHRSLLNLLQTITTCAMKPPVGRGNGGVPHRSLLNLLQTMTACAMKPPVGRGNGGVPIDLYSTCSKKITMGPMKPRSKFWIELHGELILSDWRGGLLGATGQNRGLRRGGRRRG